MFPVWVTDGCGVAVVADSHEEAVMIAATMIADQLRAEAAETLMAKVREKLPKKVTAPVKYSA